MRLQTFTLFSILLLTGCTSGGYEARHDIANDHLEVRVYGIPRHSDPTYAQLLHNRCGVQFNFVGGCEISEQTRRDADAYNRVMTPEIERRFGPGVLKRVEAEARNTTAPTRPET